MKENQAKGGRHVKLKTIYARPRAADAGYADNHSVRTFPDVAKSHWAYCEILEASNAHDYEKDARGAETWTRLK